MLATDKNAVIKAEGGPKWGVPSSTIVSSATVGYQPNPSTSGDNPDGDTAAAKALLKGAHPTIRFAYSDASPVIEQVAALLQQEWQAVGFKVTLDGIPTDAKVGYYSQVGAKVKPIDVFFAGWASDWPTLFGVVPPILQSNPAGASFGVGFNYGFYSNPKVDADIKGALAATDSATQVKDLQDADAVDGADGAYVPLANQNDYFIHGSKIGGFLPDIASSYYPDLGGIYATK